MISAVNRAMNIPRYAWVGFAICLAPATLLCLGARPAFAAKASADEARVTRIVREVKLLPSKAKARPAVLNQSIHEGTGVRTGNRSRSELTFVDLTIERLGANTIFSFGSSGRHVELESGSMLLRVPKDSGGARMTTPAVTVGITGTTVILESTRAGRNRLFVLEGGARLLLNKYPKESVYVRGGQMEDVPPGATRLPPPVNVNLQDIMNKHPLVTDFPPLPSRDLIYATMRHPPSARPSGGGPVFIPPIVGGLFGGRPAVGRRSVGGRRNRGEHSNHGKGNHTAPGGRGAPSSDHVQRRSSGKVRTSRGRQTDAKPTPTPHRKRRH